MFTLRFRFVVALGVLLFLIVAGRQSPSHDDLTCLNRQELVVGGSRFCSAESGVFGYRSHPVTRSVFMLW